MSKHNLTIVFELWENKHVKRDQPLTDHFLQEDEMTKWFSSEKTKQKSATLFLVDT